MFFSVTGFQELFLCGCIIIKQSCVFELGRIYGLCIFCPTFLKRKQSYVLNGDRCLKKSLMKNCSALSCPSLAQCICCSSVQNGRSSKQAVCSRLACAADKPGSPSRLYGRPRAWLRVLQLLLCFVRGEGSVLVSRKQMLSGIAVCLFVAGTKQEERTSANKCLKSILDVIIFPGV